jgi:predicted SAM-dependent methyltransferase
MNVQYGCGLFAPRGWINFDASPTLRLQKIPILGRLITRKHVVFPANVKYGDIVAGLPVHDDTCDAVYCSHVLEHLALQEVECALRNTFRILKPGGIFRLVLPDFEFAVKQYLNDDSPSAVFAFLKYTGLGRVKRSRGVRAVIENSLGNASHLWMWDYKGLADQLKQVGFSDIRRATYKDSKFPQFCEVEQKGRWNSALGIEANKPDNSK